MKTSKKRFLRYSVVASTAILLAAASLPNKEKITSISHAPPLFQKNIRQPEAYTFQYANATVKTARNIDYANSPVMHKDAMPAQSTLIQDSTPANCYWHLKDDDIFTEIDTSAPVVYGKPNASPAYYDVEYAAEGIEDTTCNTIDTCIANDTSVLKYVVYYPKYHNYSAVPLPCIIFFHPGGSSDCSDAYSQGFIPTMCTKLALKGYICFNVEYRRGRIKDPRRKYRAVQPVLAQYRSCQDGRGAIRSILQVERNAVSGAKFKIDTANMFLAGASAGGLIVSTAAYYSKEMVAASFPSPPGKPTIEQVLGPIDADYYLGTPDISYQPHIKGVLDMWTGVSIPDEYYPDATEFFTDTSLFAPTFKPALISFQGYKDEVFHFPEDKNQRIRFSPPPIGGTFNYNSTNNCLLAAAPGPYQLDTVIGGGYDLFIGSCLNLYHVLDARGVLTEIYVDCTAKHGVEDGDNYGTPATTKEQIWGYMAERTAVFFQAVINEKTKASLGNSLFVECKNTRERCNQSNDPPCHTLDFCLPLP